MEKEYINHFCEKLTTGEKEHILGTENPELSAGIKVAEFAREIFRLEEDAKENAKIFHDQESNVEDLPYKNVTESHIEVDICYETQIKEIKEIIEVLKTDLVITYEDLSISELNKRNNEVLSNIKSIESEQKNIRLSINSKDFEKKLFYLDEAVKFYKNLHRKLQRILDTRTSLFTRIRTRMCSGLVKFKIYLEGDEIKKEI